MAEKIKFMKQLVICLMHLAIVNYTNKKRIY